MTEVTVREYIEWGIRWDAVGHPRMQGLVGTIEWVSTLLPAPEAWARHRVARRNDNPDNRASLVRRTVRVETTHGPVEEVS